MLTRRALFGLLAGAASAAVVDPEELLWTPGKKLISIPAPLVAVDMRILTAYDFSHRSWMTRIEFCKAAGLHQFTPLSGQDTDSITSFDGRINPESVAQAFERDFLIRHEVTEMAIHRARQMDILTGVTFRHEKRNPKKWFLNSSNW